MSREELAAEHDEITMTGSWARLSKCDAKNTDYFSYSHVLHVCKKKYPEAFCDFCCDPIVLDVWKICKCQLIWIGWRTIWTVRENLEIASFSFLMCCSQSLWRVQEQTNTKMDNPSKWHQHNSEIRNITQPNERIQLLVTTHSHGWDETIVNKFIRDTFILLSLSVIHFSSLSLCLSLTHTHTHTHCHTHIILLWITQHKIWTVTIRGGACNSMDSEWLSEWEENAGDILRSAISAVFFFSYALAHTQTHTCAEHNESKWTAEVFLISLSRTCTLCGCIFQWDIPVKAGVIKCAYTTGAI